MPVASSASPPAAAGGGTKDKDGKDKGKGKAKEGKDGQPRRSQRPSWSCTECTRRKIRCDRVVPGCNQCIKRNKVHLCRLDQDVEIGFAPSGPPASLSSLPYPSSPSLTSHAPSGPSTIREPRYATATEHDAILRSIAVVRQRLTHLDRVVQAFVPVEGVTDDEGRGVWGIDMQRVLNGAGAGTGLSEGVKPEHAHAGPYGSYPPSAAATPLSGAPLSLPPPPGAGAEYSPVSSAAPTPYLGPGGLPLPGYGFPAPPPMGYGMGVGMGALGMSGGGMALGLHPGMGVGGMEPIRESSRERRPPTADGERDGEGEQAEGEGEGEDEGARGRYAAMPLEGNDDGEVEAAVTLEFLALGRDRKQDHFSRAALRRPESRDRSGLAARKAYEPTPSSLGAGVETAAGEVGAAEGETEEAPTVSAAPAAPAPAAMAPSSTAPPPGPAPTASANAPPTLAALAALLPSRKRSDALVAFSLDRVGWQHGAVHKPTFVGECGEFFAFSSVAAGVKDEGSGGEEAREKAGKGEGEEGSKPEREPLEAKERRARLVNPAWLALYFAVLCAGVKHMSAKDADEYGVPRDALHPLPKLYFDASLAALHRANFLAKHSILSVQTIVILVVACQDVGGSDLVATLLAAGIRIAQHLALHRFANDAEWEAKRRANGIDPASEQGIKGLVQREVRKRLWWALAAEDWYTIPYRRAYTIFPTHFTTPPPLNIHDADLALGLSTPRPLDEPTIASKVLQAYKVAAVIRTFFESVNGFSPSSSSSSSGRTQDLGPETFEKLLEADRQIRAIIEEGPRYLRELDWEPEDQGKSAGWMPWFRRYWIMSVSHKLLMCHRVFLGRAFRDARYGYARKAAIEAARSIIQELVRGKDLPYQDVWTVPYHAISAATTIILDIFQTPSSDPDLVHKRNEVAQALEELRLLDEEGNSAIAERGVKLLSTLLAEESKHRRPHGTGAGESRKRKAPADHDASAYSDVAKRMVSNSRTPLSASLTRSHPPPHPTPPSMAAHLPLPTPSPGSSFPLVSPSLAMSTFPYFAPSADFSLSLPPNGLPDLSASVGAGADLDVHSPGARSHASDASLTQEAFDAILAGLSGWSANPPATFGGDGTGDISVGGGVGLGGGVGVGAGAGFDSALGLGLDSADAFGGIGSISGGSGTSLDFGLGSVGGAGGFSASGMGGGDAGVQDFWRMLDQNLEPKPAEAAYGDFGAGVGGAFGGW
ncbi:hypothetical protein JCM10207_003167 [Rhodosporidiobolus poonsookiae]